MLALAFTLILGTLPTTDTATTCGDRIEASLRALEKTQPRKRAPEALRIATQCSLIPKELRAAAEKAAPLGLVARSAVLGDAARGALPKRCPFERNEAKATSLAAICPLPAPISPNSTELATLDQGTYAFGWVVLDALKNAGVRRDARTGWYLNLSLATMLERHARAAED